MIQRHMQIYCSQKGWALESKINVCNGNE